MKNSEYLMLTRKSGTVSITSLAACMILVGVIFWVAQLYSEKNIDSYLHKNAILGGACPPYTDLIQDLIKKFKGVPISPRKACWFAIEHLESNGGKEIVICEVHWIAAPLSGYLIDIKGKLTIDHEEYTTFRIGITDGDKKTIPAGEVFVLIAFRKNARGEILWWPPPGPDYDVKDGEAMPMSLLEYEFLLYRERFETLSDRYP